MANHKANLHEIVGMVLCALLSLLAFVILVIYNDRLPAILGLIISLACPVVWLTVLLWNDRDGGSLAQRVKLLQPILRWGDQPTSVPVEG